jgi:hypothetical protein
MTFPRITVLVTLSATVASGCAIPRKQHVLIDRYAAAPCLRLSSQSTTQPPVREWNATVRTERQREFRILGRQSVGGSVTARDQRTGEEHIVARAGDYVYPADVRVSSDFSRIFVKADGLAGGMWRETWLYEYDLVQLRQVSKVRVDPAVLPPECSNP